MGLASTDMKLFLQPKPGLLVKWGSAAWAQTQLTPGVSVLAAPRQFKTMRRGGCKESCEAVWSSEALWN